MTGRSNQLAEAPPLLKKVGISLLGLGCLHTMALLAGGGHYLVSMVKSGWWMTAAHGVAPPIHVGVFWSLLFGLLLCKLGWLLVRVSKGLPALSLLWGVSLGALSLLGAIAVPVGGFWLVLGLSAWLLVQLKGQPA